MAMISDVDYILQTIRLSVLRSCDDASTSRIISLDPSFALNPYINASGHSEVDEWPEIQRALDSPPLERDDDRPRRRRNSLNGLNYTQTIMGGKSGGAGMRVSGRRGRGRRPSLEDMTPRGARPRSDSAPVPKSLQSTVSPVVTGHGMSVRDSEEPTFSAASIDPTESSQVIMGTPPPDEHPEPLHGGMDEGSDVDEDEMEAEEAGMDQAQRDLRADVRASTVAPALNMDDTGIDFAPKPIRRAGSSALTAALHKHVPHLVSSSAPAAEVNPFTTLYASVSTNANGITLQIYFPHSAKPSSPITIKVRKEATVEEVTGHGLLKYWDEGREPKLSEEESEQRWSTVGWGLRIVEDDGEVDEDFPPLDRDSRVSKFSYTQFAIVEATASQIKQNAAKAPLIIRRPSRIIRPQETKPPPPPPPISSSPSSSDAALSSSMMKGSIGLGSALSKTVLLRVRITASADVHFTTTISVPSDMYIADLTEVLWKRKRLQNPSSDWVLCLADLSLALPLDRTVASLEGRTNLALVRRQWAVEHGLRIGDRRGGDPSASIFKRISAPVKPPPTDLAQTYKKFHVQRRIAIGRHPRTLAIDGDYIHIMPSESRTFFDSMKTTSFHVSLVASCKLSGKYGGFKINVWRDGTEKRYEFEADTPKQAAEIITSIRAL
ncbi:stress-activated map kinase interacting protein 1-domain-containing protein [Kockovaella imperatae]|uniref:Stress-activated map kinase interacting protein 1-domain-containing protein n=1 Tax=Kockovaella imperatae TaxID=4999 RepID=A0A1Y1U8X7_9TREE|nr:stress-activated map kinase interacting protein 1-domain-containing protein [Kockovaella imperatae]ORX33957.1 stress-activated map kinase interacting protein 1-domain-containing protein [Kockovaella imperatae]